MTDPTIHEHAGLWGGRLLVFDSLPSTNQWALDNAASLRHGDVVRAIDQTAGRGRFDRVWDASPEHSLTFSVILRDSAIPDLVPALIPLAAAVSICRALAMLGLSPGLKWPNDVLVDRKKVCGILAEHALETQSYVVGIGINVNQEPLDFDQTGYLVPATSMRLETGRAFDLETVLTAALDAAQDLLPMAATDKQTTLLQMWEQYDALTGLQILVSTPTGEIEGSYAGLSDAGALRLRRRDKEQVEILAGDVQWLMKTLEQERGA